MKIKIGRHIANNIVIDNTYISREHAVFIINEQSITLEDLNSTNGTYVNGRKIKIARVTQNDIIEFGTNYKFNWQLLDEFINKNKVKPENPQTKNSISIGRDPSNDFIINNIRVSRKHGLLISQNGNWYIEDLNSLNGIYVDGEKFKRKQVDLSSRISISGISINLSDIINKRISNGQENTLSANSVDYIINGKTIIDGVSLTIFPGEFIGLIGESGSGKTTLLTLLNGYLKPSKGTILLNSINLLENTNELKELFGYVPQEDIIHKELKVGESLKYSARLRLEGKSNNIEIEPQVKKILKLLDLIDTEDIIIGSTAKKGISGGQRKRVNLGQELISDPSILFLDEPTSGLDPRSDREIMLLLKNLAKEGKTIVLTTHNISQENFNIFTHLIVMAKGGKLVYFGDSKSICDYFEVTEPIKIFDKLKQKDSSFWENKFKTSDIYNKYVEKRKTKELEGNKKASNKKEKKSYFNFSQFFTLCERNAVIKFRDTISTIILLLQAPIIAILITMVFPRVDQVAEVLFVLIIAAIWLGASNSVREIVAEQAIFKRERKTGLNINSYLFSKFIILLLLCVIQCFLLTTIVSYSLYIENPISLFFILLVTSLSSLSLGLFISAIAKTSETAIALLPIILIPKVVLGGLISSFARMPELVKIIAGFTISRWSFEAILISQLDNNQKILAIGFKPNNLFLDLFIIIVFGLFFIIATSFILKRKD